MLCLGIESSCDDTSLALVSDGVLLAEKSISQAETHALFGGVVPELASREHARSIGILYDSLIQEAGISAKEIESISVSRAPGLLGSLLVGVSFAKALAFGLSIPLVGVNHLHAHLMAAGLEQSFSFPAIGLLISGGHTQLYRIESEQDFFLLGRTLDDAAGEAFDKAGKVMGMPYPAGKTIDILSQEGNCKAFSFPRPYLDNDNMNFSFSGLKTSILVRMKEYNIPPATWCLENSSLTFLNKDHKTCLSNLCASYTQAIIETLVEKTKRALLSHTDTNSLIVAGGVAANSHLRKALEDLASSFSKKLVIPSPKLCTDNGSMVAYLGEKLARKGIYHPLSMPAIPRGKKIPEDYCTKSF